MRRVLATGAGGSPAVNYTRSLRAAPSPYYLVGTDASPYYLMRAETDSRYLVPPASADDYLDVLNWIIEHEDVEFVHAQNDVELGFLSEHRDSVNARMCLPDPATVRILQDKFKSFERWQEAGIKVPETVIVRSQEDVENALERFGGRMWVRAITGAGGRGSLPVSDLATAINWLDLHSGWDGSFSAAELLRDDTVTWMSIWHEGELVLAQGRKRLYWELSKISPSGVTGCTGGGETVSDQELDAIAQRAVLAIDERPHGLFGVDLAYDTAGIPNPTEINVGRFFTTHQFFTELGVNMPHIFTSLAMGEEPELPAQRINPAPAGKIWIRGVDFEPVLTSREKIDDAEAQLAELRTNFT